MDRDRDGCRHPSEGCIHGIIVSNISKYAVIHCMEEGVLMRMYSLQNFHGKSVIPAHPMLAMEMLVNPQRTMLTSRFSPALA